MITFKHKGNFKNTERFLTRAQKMSVRNVLEKYGSVGVSALSNATPQDSGLTAMSWDYRIELTKWGATLTWFNRNVTSGTPIAILIQYGHGTGTGGYVPPRDYINPTMGPLFDTLAEEIWKEVSSL